MQESLFTLIKVKYPHFKLVTHIYVSEKRLHNYIVSKAPIFNRQDLKYYGFKNYKLESIFFEKYWNFRYNLRTPKNAYPTNIINLIEGEFIVTTDFQGSQYKYSKRHIEDYNKVKKEFMLKNNINSEEEFFSFFKAK